MFKKDKIPQQPAAPANGDMDADEEHKLTSELSSARSALEIERKKRRSRPLMVLLFSLLLIGLGALAAMMVYKAYFEKKPLTDSLPSATTEVKSSRLTAKQVVEMIKPKMIGKEFDNDGSGLPAVKIAGYDFYNAVGQDDPTAAHYERVIDQDKVASTHAAVNSLLVDKGFTGKQVDSADSNSRTSYYLHKDVACSFYDAMGSNESAAHMLSIDCADMSSYEAQAKTLKPFAEAFAKGSENVFGAGISPLFTGVPTVKASQAAGYRTALVSMSGTSQGEAGGGGFQGAFYQVPNKSWTYFMGTLNGYNCSDFVDEDLKKAFLGEPCTKDGQSATVTL